MDDEILTLGDLTPDPKNARRHTPRNLCILVDALHEVGAARSIVIDEAGVVLAGNATIEAAGEAGIERVRGLPYVRQWIKDKATKARLGWYWNLDDDITGFYRAAGGKCHPCAPWDALAGAEGLIEPMANVAHASLEYQQFAWSARSPYVLNSYCDVCVAVHTDRTRMARFRPEVPLKVDRDFTLQVLASGRDVVRICAWAFAAPKNGSNAGGLSDLYARHGSEAADSRRMCEMWPGVRSIHIKKDGRVDTRIDWRQFKPKALAA